MICFGVSKRAIFITGVSESVSDGRQSLRITVKDILPHEAKTLITLLEQHPPWKAGTDLTSLHKLERMAASNEMELIKKNLKFSVTYYKAG